MLKSSRLLISGIILLLVVISLITIPKLTGFTANEENQSTWPKLATFAVCEQEGEYTYCKDKLFASCNKKPIEINDSYFYCNGKRYEVNNASLGETYLSNWTDKRAKNLITAWAISD